MTMNSHRRREAKAARRRKRIARGKRNSMGAVERGLRQQEAALRVARLTSTPRKRKAAKVAPAVRDRLRFGRRGR